MFWKILVLVLLYLTIDTLAQNLVAILSATKLPVPVEGIQVVYDGEDSIYVLGGSNHPYYQGDILKFNVTAESIEKVGTVDQVAFGSAVWTGNGEIFFFGGVNKNGFVANAWSYKPGGGSNWTQIGGLPRSAGYTSSVWDRGEYSYVFGGYDSGITLNTILRYSSVTNKTIQVGELPGPRWATSAIWDDTTGDAYIFGGLGSGSTSNDIVKFNPAQGTVIKLNVTLPVATSDSCAIWTGTEAYILGGWKNRGQVTRFNPSANKVLKFPVNNFPSDIYNHHCAFVKKLNRIYVVGGHVSGYTADKILYIDFDLPPSPTSPATTNPITTMAPSTTTEGPVTPKDCKNELRGTRFPDPICCRSFYQCENQEAVPRQCPSQLHFNPSLEECDLPEIVKCRSVYESKY